MFFATGDFVVFCSTSHGVFVWLAGNTQWVIDRWACTLPPKSLITVFQKRFNFVSKNQVTTKKSI